MCDEQKLYNIQHIWKAGVKRKNLAKYINFWLLHLSLWSFSWRLGHPKRSSVSLASGARTFTRTFTSVQPACMLPAIRASIVDINLEQYAQQFLLQSVAIIRWLALYVKKTAVSVGIVCPYLSSSLMKSEATQGSSSASSTFYGSKPAHQITCNISHCMFQSIYHQIPARSVCHHL